MFVAKYLSNLILEKETGMISDFIYVILPVLSISVLMFGLRAILLDSYKPKFKKQ